MTKWTSEPARPTAKRLRWRGEAVMRLLGDRRQPRGFIEALARVVQAWQQAPPRD